MQVEVEEQSLPVNTLKGHVNVVRKALLPMAVELCTGNSTQDAINELLA